MADAYGRVEAPDSVLAKRTERRQGEDESTAKAPLQAAEDGMGGAAASMLPEHAEGKAADAQPDIFSLGAVLWLKGSD